MRPSDRSIRLLAAVATAWLCASGALAEEPLGGLPLGTPAPIFFVNTYNPQASGAKRVFLDKLVGTQASDKKKLLLLSFFNIDCKPCRKELPFLQRLHDRYKQAGLGVVVINCDFKKEKIDEVEKYIQESAFTFPVLKDRFQALQRRYAIASFPTMYLVDELGLIVAVRVGYNEETMPFPLADVQRRLGVAVEAMDEPAKTMPKPKGKSKIKAGHGKQAG